MLIYPGIAPLDVAGPLEVFGVCNFLAGKTVYDITTVAPSLDPVRSPIGITFLPDRLMSDLDLPVDTLLVAGGAGPDAGATDPIRQWLRFATPQTRRFGSICTGAFALSAAGLLDGRRATTHWAFTDLLAERAPRATIDPDAIYVRDGNLYTSAGITSGIDLALALLEEDQGRERALDVARFLVLYLKRSGGQTQFSSQLRAQFSESPIIRRVQQWCLDNLAGDLSVASVARQAVMSERSFARMFRAETGQTPAEFVAAARLDAACRRLESDGATTQAIAWSCGFGSQASLRRAFLRRLGVTPQIYRARFRAT